MLLNTIVILVGGVVGGDLQREVCVVKHFLVHYFELNILIPLYQPEKLS